MSVQQCINTLKANHHLTIMESRKALNDIFHGNVPQSTIEEFLTLLHKKGETVDEITGFAEEMRAAMIKVPLKKPAIDVCGTGGTGKDRFNVSTSVAFVLAAGNVPVAKHGNRGSVKSNGSFDFLEKLDVHIDLAIPRIQYVFDNTGLAFLFARHFHPAMKTVAAARKNLSHRTIFNCLGPLCNPAEVRFQIIGTGSKSLAEKLAAVLRKLGTKKSLVIAGPGGSDEMGITGPSTLYEVSAEAVTESSFNPAKRLNLMAKESEISGGTAEENARTFVNLISLRQIDHKLSQLIALNAGAAFYCYGKAVSIEEGYELGLHLIDTGAVWETYQHYLEVQNSIVMTRENG